MKAEALLFAGVAVFFAVTGAVYGWLSHEPAGTAVLAIAFLTSCLVSFFMATQYVRRGVRAQDRKDAEILETAGPLDFFPPRSSYPVLTGVGATVTALGVAIQGWLILVGLGILAAGVGGFVFQYNDRGH